MIICYQAEISAIRDITANSNLEETILNIFSEASVSINSKDLETYHRLNQLVNHKKVIIKLHKTNDVTRVRNNKKKSNKIKTQNIGLPSGGKISGNV